MFGKQGSLAAVQVCADMRWRTSSREMEAATGVEPVNSGFADRRLSHLAMPPPWRESAPATGALWYTSKSGPGRSRPASLDIWSGKRDSNSRPSPWQGGALPAELFPLLHLSLATIPTTGRDRATDEWSGKRDSNPRPLAWEANALPTELFPLWPSSWDGGRCRT